MKKLQGVQISSWLILTVLCIMPFSVVGQHRVVAYYPGWMKTKLPANKVKFEHITHINHAFAWPLANGDITGYSEINHPELIAEAHKAGRKILIALGGWGQSDGFAPMAADSTVRQKFVKNLVDYCASRGYDGADIDWEFPKNAAERANLTILIKEIRQAFDQANPNLLLTMVAVTSNFSGQWHDYAALASYVDWFNLMAYDFHGSWTNHAGHNSPLYAPNTDFDGSGHQGVQYLRDRRGVPKEKIILGMPFYGKECSASRLYDPSPSNSWTGLEYSLVAPRLNSNWDYFWDEISKVPYLLNTARTQFVTYDDSLSISFKCEYAKANGLAGVMIWALGQDVMNNHSQPLLEAVGRAMQTTGVAESPRVPAPKLFELLGNYPNPFNGSTRIEFNLNQPGTVELVITNISGAKIQTLRQNFSTAGRKAFRWEATDDRGEPVTSGIYFYTIVFQEGTRSGKMLYLR